MHPFLVLFTVYACCYYHLYIRTSCLSHFLVLNRILCSFHALFRSIELWSLFVSPTLYITHSALVYKEQCICALVVQCLSSISNRILLHSITRQRALPAIILTMTLYKCLFTWHTTCSVPVLAIFTEGKMV